MLKTWEKKKKQHVVFIAKNQLQKEVKKKRSMFVMATRNYKLIKLVVTIIIIIVIIIIFILLLIFILIILILVIIIFTAVATFIILEKNKERTVKNNRLVYHVSLIRG